TGHTTPPPPAPTALATQSKHDTQIVLGWNSGGGNTANFMLFIAAGSVAPGCNAGRPHALITSAMSTYTWKGLRPGTQYTYSLCAANSYNMLSSPVNLSVTTDPPTVPPAPTSLLLSSADPVSLQWQWASGGGNTAG